MAQRMYSVTQSLQISITTNSGRVFVHLEGTPRPVTWDTADIASDSLSAKGISAASLPGVDYWAARGITDVS